MNRKQALTGGKAAGDELAKADGSPIQRRAMGKLLDGQPTQGKAGQSFNKQKAGMAEGKPDSVPTSWADSIHPPSKQCTLFARACCMQHYTVCCKHRLHGLHLVMSKGGWPQGEGGGVLG